MRLRGVILPVLLSSASAVAMAPEEEPQRKLDAAIPKMQEACHNQAKVVLDLDSFDEESLSNKEFSPTYQCLNVVEGFTQLCKDIPATNLTNKIDATALIELTEIRCALDVKREKKLRAWLKEHPRRKRHADLSGDKEYRAFLATVIADIPNPRNPGEPSVYSTAEFIWKGNKVEVIYTQEISNQDEAIQGAVRAEARARGAKPGSAARKKALEDKFNAAVNSKNDSTWKFIAEGNNGTVRECDARLAEAVKNTREKCDVTIDAAIDWASVEAPGVDDVDLCRAVGSQCSVSQDLERFASQCVQVLEGLMSNCDDDKLQAIIVKKVKSVACKFERSTNKGKKGTTSSGSFPLVVKDGVLTATWAWDSDNHVQRTSEFVKNRL